MGVDNRKAFALPTRRRPKGYVPPPRPSLAAVARTLSVAALEIPRFAAMLLFDSIRSTGSTTTASGVAEARRTFSAALTRLGIDLVVLGVERVPPEGGLIFMWNQASHLDHLVLPPALPRPFFSLFNNELGAFPIYGAHLRRTGHVHVDRTDEAQWRPAVASAARRVERGECALISPEGTRSWDGRLLPMKRGALILATAAQRPIICASIVGAHERLPRGAAIVRPGRIIVELSEPIDVRDDTEAERARLAGVVAETFQQALDGHGPQCGRLRS
jgi:1-acyl-sn-glycerol-3-phosphate acyltransferase